MEPENWENGVFVLRDANDLDAAGADILVVLDGALVGESDGGELIEDEAVSESCPKNCRSCMNACVTECKCERADNGVSFNTPPDGPEIEPDDDVLLPPDEDADAIDDERSERQEFSLGRGGRWDEFRL